MLFYITVTSYWVLRRLKSPALRLFTRPFIRAQIKENIKATRHWPLCREFTGDQWIPRTTDQWRGKCFHLATLWWNAVVRFSKCEKLETLTYKSVLGSWYQYSIGVTLCTTMYTTYSDPARLIFVVFWHDDVIKWKHFPRYWPFVRGIHRSLVNSPHKGQWRGGLMFSLICVWINGWVNNREAGDLRRYRAHYDVTIMNYGIRLHSEGWGFMSPLNETLCLNKVRLFRNNIH